MALQSDSQGFLVGDPVDLSRVIDQFRQIRQDVADIKRSMLGAVANVNRNSRSSSEGSNARNQDSSTSGQSSSGNSGAATPNRPRGRNGSSDGLPPENPNGTVTPNGRGRDTSGRFSGNSESSSGSATARNNDDRKSQGIISGFTDRIATAVKASAAGAEEADPTIKAFQEVAEPMRRGYEIFAGGDKKDRWYKKIFKELNLFRKDETAFNRAANRSLHNIEGNPGGGGNNGGGGLLAMLAGLLGGRAAGAAGGGLLGLAGKGLLGAGKGLLGAGKGLLKRIPLLGALIGGVSAASDIYGTETDDSLTRGEKDGRNGKAAGGLAGSVGGMMAGAAAGSLLGPVGTVVGGAVGMFLGDQAGQIIGEKMGGWTTQLRNANIPDKIIGAWETTTSAIKSGWAGALRLMSSAWDKTKEAANAANDFVKDKTGVDVKAEVKNAYDNAVKYTADNIIPSLADLANKGADKLKQGSQWAGDNTTLGKGVKAIGGKIGDRWNDAKQYLTGASEKAGVDPGTLAKIANYESSFNADATPTRKDGSKISSAHGYGQFLDGTWTDMVNKYGSKYGVEGAGKMTKDQAAKYRDDKTVQAGMLAEFTRENVEKGRKLGGSDDDANVYALHNLGSGTGPEFLKALRNNPNAPVNSVKGMSDKVISGNKSLYGDGKITLAEAYAKMGNAMNKGDVFANDIRASSSGEAPPAVASISEDPTQGGRYKYEKLEGGKIQVTDNQTGVMELASDEQANAYRKQQGKPYLDKVAAINANNMPAYYDLAAGPVNTQVQTASATSPRVPTFAPHPAIGEAPPVIQPLASDSNRNLTVTMPTPDVGQDVRDRNIAHIVTGGFSGRG